MRKLKLTKEMLADAILGRLLQTLNKEARDSLISTTDEQWVEEINKLRLYLNSMSWRGLTVKYVESIGLSAEDLLTKKEDKDES